MRHAVFGERLLGLGRVDAVRFVEALLRFWQSANVAVQNALLAWALWTIRLRRDKRSSVLDGLRETAAAEGLDLVALLLSDPPAHRSLPPGGRLHDVYIDSEAWIDLATEWRPVYSGGNFFSYAGDSKQRLRSLVEHIHEVTRALGGSERIPGARTDSDSHRLAREAREELKWGRVETATAELEEGLKRNRLDVPVLDALIEARVEQSRVWEAAEAALLLARVCRRAGKADESEELRRAAEALHQEAWKSEPVDAEREIARTVGWDVLSEEEECLSTLESDEYFRRWGQWRSIAPRSSFGDLPPSVVEPLLRHPDPRLIEKLLRKPWLATSHVLRIASRRPTVPGIVLAIATHDRWMNIRQVREALALNPFTPTAAALVLLPTIGASVLRDFSEGQCCHPAVAEASVRLLALAPAHAESH